MTAIQRKVSDCVCVLLGNPIGMPCRMMMMMMYGADAQDEEAAEDIKERMEHCCKGDLGNWSRIPCTITFYISLNDTQAFNFASRYTTQHRQNRT